MKSRRGSDRARLGPKTPEQYRDWHIIKRIVETFIMVTVILFEDGLITCEKQACLSPSRCLRILPEESI